MHTSRSIIWYMKPQRHAPKNEVYRNGFSTQNLNTESPSFNPMLLLNPLQPLLSLLQIRLSHLPGPNRTFPRHLFRLVIQNHQVPIHEVISVELVTGLFRVGDLIVYHESRSLCAR